MANLTTKAAISQANAIQIAVQI